MKKLLAMLLTAALLLTLAACSGSAQPKTPTGEPALPSLHTPVGSETPANGETTGLPVSGTEPVPAVPSAEAPATDRPAPATDAPAPETTAQTIEPPAPTATSEHAAPQPSSANPATPVPSQDASLQAARSVVRANGAVFGVIFLGFTDPEDPPFDREGVVFDKFLTNTEYAEKYPFLRRIDASHILDAGGTEVYCIVPMDESTDVTAYFQVTDENVSFASNIPLLMEVDGAPFVIRCNVSDVVSNALIVASNSNGEVTWEPCLSLNDSSVVLPAKGVCDLS